MDRRLSEIVVVFKQPPHAMFPHSEGVHEANRLHIHLQPDEGMRMHMTAKEPGPGGIRLRPVSLDLSYATTFDQRLPDAYERLLMDVIRGNPTLFMRRDEVEAAWTWVEPILHRWAARPSDRGSTPPAPPAPPPPPRSSSATAEPGRRPTSDPSSLRPQDQPDRRGGDRRIVERSRPHRDAYLARIDAADRSGPARTKLACANLAHGFAASEPNEKQALRRRCKPNIAIVTAYNDMLSAHQPYGAYPPILKDAVLRAGGIAQVAGGVPAMCDGITQGRDGMQLSLFSRDLIAMSAAVALSHDMFDGALMLGVCDKIVPGLLIGASVLRPPAHRLRARPGR